MLDTLLQPLSRARFFSDHWTKAPLYVAGSSGRFAELFSWDFLASILDLHWQDLKHPALRLVRDGRVVPERRYSEAVTTAREGTVFRPSASRVRELCENGATLVVNAVNRRCRSVGDLALSLSREFGHPVQVNSYYSQADIQGFDLHYDSHAIFVLQIEGRKRWTVSSELPKLVLPSELYTAATPASGPYESYLLTPGDVLYLPRGLWHAAVADEEPSLHLTLGIYTFKRLDFAIWLIEKMCQGEALRPNLFSAVDNDEFLDSGARETVNAIAGFMEELRGSEDSILVEFARSQEVEQLMEHRVFDLPIATRGT